MYQGQPTSYISSKKWEEVLGEADVEILEVRWESNECLD